MLEATKVRFLSLSLLLTVLVSMTTCGGAGVAVSPSSSTAPVAHSAILKWDSDANSPVPVIGYFVYRGIASGGPYTRLNSSVVTITSYMDSAVQAGQMYFYVVTAVGSDNVESGLSNEVRVTIPSP
jgi:fibronectin type 3 domain-containing protein